MVRRIVVGFGPHASARFGYRARFGKVDRPSLVRDRTESGDDIGDEIIVNDVVEVMQNRWGSFGVRPHDDFKPTATPPAG